MNTTVSVMLVVTLIALAFTLYKAIKAREFVLVILAMVTMALFNISQPEIPKTINEFLSKIAEMVIGIFS